MTFRSPLQSSLVYGPYVHVTILILVFCSVITMLLETAFALCIC